MVIWDVNAPVAPVAKWPGIAAIRVSVSAGKNRCCRQQNSLQARLGSGPNNSISSTVGV
jgi:hypothetical protein